MTKMALGASSAKQPNPVATPLPPRNFSHTGKMCPRIANNAANPASTTDGVEDHGAIQLRAMTTAPKPLNPSSRRVTMPRTGDVRATLVAQIFQLLFCRLYDP